MRRNWRVLRYTPPAFVSANLFAAACAASVGAYAYLPEALARTVNLRETVARNWHVFRFLEDAHKDASLAALAVELNWRAIAFVPFHLETTELVKRAAEKLLDEYQQRVVHFPPLVPITVADVLERWAEKDPEMYQLLPHHRRTEKLAYAWASANSTVTPRSVDEATRETERRIRHVEEDMCSMRSKIIEECPSYTLDDVKVDSRHRAVAQSMLEKYGEDYIALAKEKHRLINGDPALVLSHMKIQDPDTVHMRALFELIHLDWRYASVIPSDWLDENMMFEAASQSLDVMRFVRFTDPALLQEVRNVVLEDWRRILSFPFDIVHELLAPKIFTGIVQGDVRAAMFVPTTVLGYCNMPPPATEEMYIEIIKTDMNLYWRLPHHARVTAPIQLAAAGMSNRLMRRQVDRVPKQNIKEFYDAGRDAFEAVAPECGAETWEEKRSLLPYNIRMLLREAEQPYHRATRDSRKAIAYLKAVAINPLAVIHVPLEFRDKNVFVLAVHHKGWLRKYFNPEWTRTVTAFTSDYNAVLNSIDAADQSYSMPLIDMYTYVKSYFIT